MVSLILLLLGNRIRCELFVALSHARLEHRTDGRCEVDRPRRLKEEKIAQLMREVDLLKFASKHRLSSKRDGPGRERSEHYT